MGKQRTWRVWGRDDQDRVIESHFTDKEAARTRAETWANKYGNPFRASTSGHFGSFTVEPTT